MVVGYQLCTLQMCLVLLLLRRKHTLRRRGWVGEERVLLLPRPSLHRAAGRRAEGLVVAGVVGAGEGRRQRGRRQRSAGAAAWMTRGDLLLCEGD